LCAAIGISIIAQTISQILAGMHYTPAQFILFIFSFIIMSCFAIWFLTKGLRHITPEKQPAAPIPG
jgi:ABC-type nickel/cobalt efflux system permease component RcnA